MSLSGGVERSYTFLWVRWSRNLEEHDVKLVEGSSLEIEAGPLSIHVYDTGRSLRKRFHKPDFKYHWFIFGFMIDAQLNGETFEKQYTGDAVYLDPTYQRDRYGF